MANEISVTRGDTRTITVTVTDSDSVIFNLTGYTMKMSVKKNKDDPDSEAIFTSTATISTPATGVGVFGLTVANTTQTPGDYWYDVQIATASSTSVYTVITPTKFTIGYDITRASP